MLVNIFFHLIVERSFFEIQIRVYHCSVHVQQVVSIIFFIENVTLAIDFLLQKSVVEWNLIDFLPLLNIKAKVFGPLVNVEFLYFNASFLL